MRFDNIRDMFSNTIVKDGQTGTHEQAVAAINRRPMPMKSVQRGV
jgi:hypothetical protein